MREPIVAGQFYSDDKEELTGEIQKAFNKVPDTFNKNCIGAIVPHAGYMFSGECAAYSYKTVGDNFDLFIILGFSHRGYGKGGAGASKKDWKTPLGICRTDKNFADMLIENNIAMVDEESHMLEHSIEVQLPFIQYLNKDIKILAISVPNDIDFIKIGKMAAEIIKTSKKRVCVLASSDFTHYGRNYGYVPFHDNIRENLKKLDMGAVKHIEDLDSTGFLEYIDKTGATICGSSPIALQIEIMKGLGVKKADLIKYYTSADITGDFMNSVSYISVIYKK